MSTPPSYLLCGTPRTGSTLLCNLLSSTEVLGRPQSYFREPDEAAWARRFGLPTEGRRVRDYHAFVRAVRAAGTTGNGVFAARVMWGSLDRVMSGLFEPKDQNDVAVLERTFGRMRFVHLEREDFVGQAVSWFRAEHTDFWQEGDVASRPAEPDLDRMKQLVDTIREHNDGWRSWFDRVAVPSHHVTYEQLLRNRRATVEGIAAHVGVEVPPRWRPDAPDKKQADVVNAEWAAALAEALGL